MRIQINIYLIQWWEKTISKHFDLEYSKVLESSTLGTAEDVHPTPKILPPVNN